MFKAFVFKGLKSAFVATALLTACAANADIVISGTRVIYPQSSKDVIVNLDNHGDKPRSFRHGWTTGVMT